MGHPRCACHRCSGELLSDYHCSPGASGKLHGGGGTHLHAIFEPCGWVQWQQNNGNDVGDAGLFHNVLLLALGLLLLPSLLPGDWGCFDHSCFLDLGEEWEMVGGGGHGQEHPSPLLHHYHPSHPP